MWELLARSLEASTIFLFAALGELIDQRSGVLNVGLEGLMLFGGTAAFITAQTTGSYPLGFLAGLAVGGLLGLAHAFFSITLRGDQVVSGMGLWILSFGLTTYLGSAYTGPLGLARIPSLMGLSPFFLVGGALVAITWLLIFRTSLGLGIRQPGPRVFLHVEPLDLAGGCLAVWDHVAAVAQPGTRPPRGPVSVCVEDGALRHHDPDSGGHLHALVPNPVGPGEARGAGPALPIG